MTAHPTYKELHRSRSDRMLGGVCGGLGEYFDVNPVFYRVGFVILTLLGGAGLLVYGACVLVVPDAGEHESIASDILKNHRQRPIALAGLALVAVAGVALLSHVSWHFHSGTFWLILLIVGVSLLWAQRRPAPAHAAAGEPAGLPVGRERNRWRPLRLVLGTTALLLAIVAATTAAFVGPHLHLGDGVGSRTFEPASLASVRSEYHLGVGDLKLDLSHAGLEGGAAPTTIHARLGIGLLEVTVPRGVTVRTSSRVVWGDSKLLGNNDNGHDVVDEVGSAHPQLILDARVGIGEVRVTRAPA